MLSLCMNEIDDSVSTFGAHLKFQYHCCEEIVYFSRDLSTTFIQYIQHTEVMANQLKSNRCCALKSMYWNSVSTSSISVPQLWRDSLQGILVLLSFNILPVPLLWRLKSMRWNSVSTFGAHLQFQYHWIVYFSSTAFFHSIYPTYRSQGILVRTNISNIPKSWRTSWSPDAFIVHWNSVSTFGAHLHWTTAVKRSTFQGILVLLSFNISNIPKSRRTSWSQTDAFKRLKSMYWNSVSTFGAHLQFQYHCIHSVKR